MTTAEGTPRGNAKPPWALVIVITLIGIIVIAGVLVGTKNIGVGGGTSADNGVRPSCTPNPTLMLASTGHLTVGTDPSNFPMEFADPDNASSYKGLDIDLANELAKRLCLTVTLRPGQLSSLVADLADPPLGLQKYDLVISGMTITNARQQRADMLPYFASGESILVQSGNPKGITSIGTLCGKIVAVQDNTAEFDQLQDVNGNGAGNSGAPAGLCVNNKVIIAHYSDQNTVIQQVLSGSADASYQDQPVTGYFVAKNPGKLQEGGITVPPSPMGIMVRKDNPDLERALTQALTAMRTDGTYLRILRAWGAEKLAYPTLSSN
jgi:polar amino acid transport system substrate-binding protein